jgi:hypothetical protein
VPRRKLRIPVTCRTNSERRCSRPNAIFRKRWDVLSNVIKERGAEILAQGEVPPSAAEQEIEDPKSFLLLITGTAISLLKNQIEDKKQGVRLTLDPASDLVAVLSAEAQDRVLRADAAAERALNRAMDRLERLQRRRLGEVVPPPVSVHLSR